MSMEDDLVKAQEILGRIIESARLQETEQTWWGWVKTERYRLALIVFMVAWILREIWK